MNKINILAYNNKVQGDQFLKNKIQKNFPIGKNKLNLFKWE
jgi:hypothetical protein